MNESYAVGADGFIFTSPSIYVIFPVISATNECGQLGHVYTSLTESFAPGELSTIDGLSFTYGAFNAGDLPCPPSDGFETELDINSKPASLDTAIMAFESVYAQEVKPFVQLPDRVTQLDPAWMSCGLSLIDVGIDPPRALKPAANLAPEVTAVAPKPKATLAAPRPKADPPVPTPTLSPVFTEPSQEASPAPAPASFKSGQSGASIPPFDPNNITPAQLSHIHQVLQPSAPAKPAATNPYVAPFHPLPNDNGPKTPVVNSVPGSNAGSNGQQTQPALAPAPTEYGNSNSKQPQNEPAAAPAKPSPAQNNNPTPNVVVAQGQILTENGASVTIDGKPAMYSAGSVYYDSTPVAMPAASGQQNLSPVAAGGVTFSPAAQANPQVNSAPVIAGSLSLTPVHISDPSPPSAHQAITAGSLIATPVEAISAPDMAPIEVGGMTMTPVAGPAAQVVSTRIMGGRPIPITLALGAADSSPQAYVVAGSTVYRGGPSAVLSGTIVALPSAGGVVVGSNTFAAPAPAGSVVTLGAQQFTAVPGGFVADDQTVQVGRPVDIAGTMASLGPAGLSYGNQIAAVAPPISASSVITVGSQPFTIVPIAGGFAVNGHVVSSGQSINDRGTAVVYGPSGLAIGTSTVPPSMLPSATLNAAGQAITPGPGGYAIDGTTVLPNQAVTVSGTVISLNPSQIIIGSSTIPLPASETMSSTLTVNGQVLTALPNGGGYVDNRQTILPGSSAITLSGTGISLAAGASAIVIGSSTIQLATGISSGLLTAAGETFTPLAPGIVAIDGNTISVGGPPITDHGTVISVAPSGLLIGGSTFAFATPAPSADKNGFVIDGQTLIPDGAAITISGTSLSLGETALTVGTSTIPLANVTADAGLGGAILSGLGAQPTSSVVPFAGKGDKPDLPGLRELICGVTASVLALVIW